MSERRQVQVRCLPKTNVVASQRSTDGPEGASISSTGACNVSADQSRSCGRLSTQQDGGRCDACRGRMFVGPPRFEELLHREASQRSTDGPEGASISCTGACARTQNLD